MNIKQLKEEIVKDFGTKFRTGEKSWHPNYVEIEKFIRDSEAL